MHRGVQVIPSVPRIGLRRTDGRGQRLGYLSVLVLILGVAVGCEPGDRAEDISLEAVDSVLAELGGSVAADLERGQRWRMISFIGAGLPPSNFGPNDLPMPGSRGAGLLQVYCIQCHWLPTPQMHTAGEWPVLMGRMLLRARTLRDRMGGPLTSGLVGEVLMAGLTTAELPAPEEVDTMLAYLRANALPAATPGELTQGPGLALFSERCSICHELPSPKAHTAAGWDQIVPQMRGMMAVMGVEPLTDAESDEIAAYLRGRAAQ